MIRFALRALELLAYPADRFSPWRDLLARAAAPLLGVYLSAPLINRRMKGVLAWFRGDPVRFRVWLLFWWWPFCNFRRLVLAILAPGRPACLHVRLGPGVDSIPSATLLSELPAWPAGSGMMRLCVLSDTHGQHELFTPRIPACDVLFHCGDIMTEDRGNKCADGGSGALARLEDFGSWLASLPCGVAVLIAGNHDAILEDLGPARVREALRRGADRADPLAKVLYLADDCAAPRGLRVFGTPLNAANSAASQNRAFQPPFGTGVDAPRVPDGPLDVLLTHGPPAGALDGGAGVPCLAELVRRERPALHIFGHQHLAYGVAYDPALGTLFVNAACCDGLFAPLHPPVVIDAPAARLCGGHSAARARCPAQRSAPGFQLYSAAGARIFRSPWTLGMRREEFAFDAAAPMPTNETDSSGMTPSGRAVLQK